MTRKDAARYGNTSTLPRLLLAGLDSIGEVGFIGILAAKSSEGLEELFLTPCFSFKAFFFHIYTFERIGTREREDLLLPIMTRDQRFDVLFAPIP